MEKKFYNTPEAKFIKLRSKAAMLAGTKTGEDDENAGMSKVCSFSFEEDED